MNTHDDPMRCPRCRSRYVQSLNMAHSQAVREHPNFEMTNFVKRIAPPPRRSQFLHPALAGMLVAVFVFIGVDFSIHKTGLRWTPNESYFEHPYVAGAAILTGLVVAYIAGALAASYNERAFPGAYLHWSRQAVCRRCSLVFTPNVDLATDDEGAQ